MKQAYALPMAVPAGRARALRDVEPIPARRRYVPGLLAGAAKLVWRVTFRLLKLFVLLPLALALAFLVWFSVRLIRG